jgi:hypothetical protein
VYAPAERAGTLTLYVLCVWDITNVVDPYPAHPDQRPDHRPVSTLTPQQKLSKFILNRETEFKYFDEKRYFLSQVKNLLLAFVFL